MVDASAEREDRREIGQAGEAALRVLPARDIVHGAPVEGLAERHHWQLRQQGGETRAPILDMPDGHCHQQAHGWDASITGMIKGPRATGPLPSR